MVMGMIIIMFHLVIMSIKWGNTCTKRSLVFVKCTINDYYNFIGNKRTNLVLYCFLDIWHQFRVGEENNLYSSIVDIDTFKENAWYFLMHMEF